MTRAALPFTLALASCATASAAKTEPEIVSFGFASGIENTSLARTTAENRALAGLGKMLEVDAVAFAMKKTGEGRALEIEVPSVKIEGAVAEIVPANNGWMAKARVLRSPETVRAMSALRAVKTRGKARHADTSLAYAKAESRAIAEAIDKATGGEDGFVRGRLSVVSITPRFKDQEVEVELVSAVKIESRSALGADDTRAVRDAAIAEHRAFGELDEAIALAARHAETREEKLALAELEIDGGHGAAAARRLWALYREDKNDKSVLERAKAAIKLVPAEKRSADDAALAAEIEREIQSRSGLR